MIVAKASASRSSASRTSSASSKAARLAFLTAGCTMTVPFRSLDAYGGERFPGVCNGDGRQVRFRSHPGANRAGDSTVRAFYRDATMVVSECASIAHGSGNEGAALNRLEHSNATSRAQRKRFQ